MSAHGSAVSSNSSGVASDSDAEQEGLQAFTVSSSSSSSSGHVPHEETDDDVILQDNLARYCLENFEAGVKDHTLEQLHLPDEWIEEIKITWHDFIEKAGSRQAAGEAVWDAIMELSPGIRKAFSFARQVFAMRFINGTSSIITDCGEPRTLKDKAERLAFQHIDTVDRDYVETFSNGIAVAMDGILGRRFSQLSYQSFRVLWNYIGGVFLYVKREYGGRVKRIIKSWQVTNKNVGKDPATESVGKDLPAASTQSEEAPGSREAKSQKRIQTPETFKDMFMFNASIMGFTDSEWMSSTLDALGAMATNADKPYRVQEECHVLALVLCRKYLKGKQKLSLAPFKAVLRLGPNIQLNPRPAMGSEA
ncbi:unnamed protein product [Symbiodinium natans]|uniref:Uncharacterized protein n=1 Tax=Symbiodinium natans TaxID=878477 RepID=A0A812SJH8_9DINO|nr:unnamed protein product [Symbiodinium natans]